MKSVLISIKPYWVFLIIAKAMGWEYPQEKTVEVRKNFPKEDWNRVVEIYCTKDKASFNQIPKEYQPLMEVFLGKVVGKFVCDKIIKMYVGRISPDGYICLDTASEISRKCACLTEKQLYDYTNGGRLYGWHISDLKIYDKPKELNTFYNLCYSGCEKCNFKSYDTAYGGNAKELVCAVSNKKYLTRPPQSWCYVV